MQDRLKTTDVKPMRGRPRAPSPRTTVCTWLPTVYADRLIELSRAQGDRSVSATVRQLLILRLR